MLVAKERNIELEALTAQQADSLASILAKCAQLEQERDTATGNLLKAEKELNDVGEYSTKMFRQVCAVGVIGATQVCWQRCSGCLPSLPTSP